VVKYNANERAAWGYPISLREQLSEIRIPLRETDAEAPLNLRAVLDRVRADGPFDFIDYTKPPSPPLSAGDAVWLEARIKGAVK